MALQKCNIYHKMKKVFGLFEEGKLKGQKCVMMKGAMLQKAIEGKLAPKLHHFKVFQGLDVSIIMYTIIYYNKHYNVGQREGRSSSAIVGGSRHLC